MGPNSADKKYTPVILFLIVIFSIAISNYLIAFLWRLFPSLSFRATAFLDSCLLTAVILPVLYAFFYRPLRLELLHREKNEAVLRTLALFDELTGLYNRRGFFSFADQLLKYSNRSKQALTIIYADLDNLKEINDRFGHHVGDKALSCIAKVLKSTFRGSDIIGRLGGDEFAVLALEATQEKIDLLRRRLAESLKEADCKKEMECAISLSCGIVAYNPEKPSSIEELLEKADSLMYEEKKHSKKLY